MHLVIRELWWKLCFPAWLQIIYSAAHGSRSIAALKSYYLRWTFVKEAIKKFIHIKQICHISLIISKLQTCGKQTISFFRTVCKNLLVQLDFNKKHFHITINLESAWSQNIHIFFSIHKKTIIILCDWKAPTDDKVS